LELTAEAALIDCRWTGPLDPPASGPSRPRSCHARVGAKSGFVPEEDVAALGLCLPGRSREYIVLPTLYRFRVTLVGPLQRLLGG